MSTIQHDQLIGFLAANEASCPVCGYNLHAVTSGTCPECGHRPELGLSQPDVLGRRRGLLLLVFAWLLLAGAMNAYTETRDIRTALTMQPQLLTLIAPQAPAGPIEVDLEVTGDEPVLIERTSRFTFGASRWTPVGWVDWARATWWTLLALVALVALVVLVRYRRRAASRRLGATLLATAWVGFGGYFAFHVVRFVGVVT